MSTQNIIEKPVVYNFDDEDTLFINHNGVLRQIPVEDTGFLSDPYDIITDVEIEALFE